MLCLVARLAKSIVRALQFKGLANAPVPINGEATIYFDGTSKKLMASENGGEFVPLIGAGASGESITEARELEAADNGRTFTDAGAEGDPDTRPLTLPPATGSFFRARFLVTDLGLRVMTVGEAQIRIGGALSDEEGYVESTELGAWVELIDVAENLWVGITPGGWTVE